jgi:hypothetical protein
MAQLNTFFAAMVFPTESNGELGGTKLWALLFPKPASKIALSQARRATA